MLFCFLLTIYNIEHKGECAMNKNIERFIRYAKIDTQADDTTGTTPSTEKQKNLGRLLVKECHWLKRPYGYSNTSYRYWC